VVSDERWERFSQRHSRFAHNVAALGRTSIRTSNGQRMSAAQLLRQPEVRLEALVAAGDVQLTLSAADRELDLVSAETTLKYDGYLRRQAQVVERNRKQENRPIPADFEYGRVPGLSRELVQRFTQVRPATLGQALRIPGATPAAVAVVAAYVRRATSPPPNPVE
jgi:tRNA uridine 5-carboxymethylaminomethyl modification enzyme